MPVENILVLALIVAMFLAFMGTLAWVSEAEGRVRKVQPAARPSHPPLGAHHA
ncbi:MAG: hypothetical protein ACREFI_09250 [Stellaceae bacterium]